MILLLGGTGQIGWELRRTLAPLGALSAPPRAECDLMHVDAIETLISRERPRMVVNAAAFTNVNAAEVEPAIAFRVNAHAVARLAATLAELGIPLVHFSTDYVFPGDATVPYVESDTLGPLNQYGRSKAAGENAVRAAGGPHLILRTSWVYGARGSNFLTTIVERVARGNLVEVVSDQVGVPTWSRFAAEACAHLCRSALEFLAAPEPGPGPLWGTYHMAPTGSTSWFGFAEYATRFLRIRGVSLPGMLRPVPTARRNDRVRRPRYSALSARLLEAQFGLEMPPWEQSLELMLEDALLRRGFQAG